MTTSILSFPERGTYGKSNWRGNCSGYIIREMLEYFRPQVFVDPAEGGGTSGDVSRELKNKGWQIEYIGLDLQSGFNLLKDSLRKCLGTRSADYVFFHPPYANMIRYSGYVWGNKAHPDDLSNCKNYEDFLTKMTVALQNIYEAVTSGGNYSILIGDLRKNGEYISIQSDLLQLAPGKLTGVLIKAQHNCASEYKNYSGKFIPISHEYLLNFRKDRIVFGMLDLTLAASQKLELLSRANWNAVIGAALIKLGGKARLPDLYEIIERDSPKTVKPRPNWQARVRATLQAHFTSVERGVWECPH